MELCNENIVAVMVGGMEAAKLLVWRLILSTIPLIFEE